MQMAAGAGPGEDGAKDGPTRGRCHKRTVPQGQAVKSAHAQENK